MPPAPRARWRLPRLTPSVFRDLAVWMVGLGLLTGAVFPLFMLALGVSVGQALTVRFFAATLTAGLVVGGVNYLLARGVVGIRVQLLAQRTGFVSEMVSYATDTGDWSHCDPERCSIPVDSDDELGECARAFNSLIGALERSHGIEAAIRDLFEVLSSHLEIDALSQAVLGRLLQHCSAQTGAVLVDIDRELHVTAAHALPDTDWLTSAPEVLAVLRTRVPERLPCPGAGGVALMITPIEFEQHVLGCLALPVAEDGDAKRLIALFSHAFGVALNNTLTHARSERLASLDALTGAASRHAGLRVLEREIDAAHHSQRNLSVLMIDLDHFKRINDRHGHLAGDRVLAAAARAIQTALRAGDTLMRYGGEEFLAVLPGADAAYSDNVAQRALQAVRDASQADITTTASIGSATLAAGEHTDDLLERADQALYAAKAAGRDRVIAAKPPQLTPT